MNVPDMNAIESGSRGERSALAISKRAVSKSHRRPRPDRLGRLVLLALAASAMAIFLTGCSLSGLWTDPSQTLHEKYYGVDAYIYPSPQNIAKFIDHYSPSSQVGVTVAVSVWYPDSGSFVQRFEANLSNDSTEYFNCACSGGDTIQIMIAIYPPHAKPKISFTQYVLQRGGSIGMLDYWGQRRGGRPAAGIVNRAGIANLELGIWNRLEIRDPRYEIPRGDAVAEDWN